MKPTLLTTTGAQMLREELRRLVTVERPLIIEAIAAARDDGNIHENPELAIAREKQAVAEGRIVAIESTLSSARIVDPSAVDAQGRVAFGATVHLRKDETGEEATYQLVGEDEADVKAGKVSVAAPLAQALLGAEEGHVVTVVTPSGEWSYRILEVHYE